MRPNRLPVVAKTAGGPALAALMRGGAWREDAAGDTPSRIAEATHLPPHPPAPPTPMATASCPLAGNALKTSVKGEHGRGPGMGEWKVFKRRGNSIPAFIFYLN